MHRTASHNNEWSSPNVNSAKVDQCCFILFRDKQLKEEKLSHNLYNELLQLRGVTCSGAGLLETDSKSPIFLIFSPSLFVFWTTPAPRGSISLSNWTNAAPYLWLEQLEVWLWRRNQEFRSLRKQQPVQMIKNSLAQRMWRGRHYNHKYQGANTKNVASRVWTSDKKSFVGLIFHEYQGLRPSRL